MAALNEVEEWDSTTHPSKMTLLVDTGRIAELLQPFVGPSSAGTGLSQRQLAQISTYIDLLLRWNARVNLTAIRDPEEIVTRHFGESLFVARHLFPGVADTALTSSDDPIADHPISFGHPPSATSHQRLLDIGSGAGFPGLPIKIWAPATPVILVESRQKKVAFLREVIRTLTLTDIDVFAGRAEDLPERYARIVTLRAVERFDQILPIAAARLAPAGTLALLIGAPQAEAARKLLPSLHWDHPIPMPSSAARILLCGALQNVITRK